MVGATKSNLNHIKEKRRKKGREQSSNRARSPVTSYRQMGQPFYVYSVHKYLNIMSLHDLLKVARDTQTHHSTPQIKKEIQLKTTQTMIFIPILPCEWLTKKASKQAICLTRSPLSSACNWNAYYAFLAVKYIAIKSDFLLWPMVVSSKYQENKMDSVKFIVKKRLRTWIRKKIHSQSLCIKSHCRKT